MLKNIAKHSEGWEVEWCRDTSLPGVKLEGHSLQQREWAAPHSGLERSVPRKWSSSSVLLLRRQAAWWCVSIGLSGGKAWMQISWLTGQTYSLSARGLHFKGGR